MNSKTLYLTQGAIIAALYVILTLITNAAGLANGVIQVRISEALCVLPIFTPAAVPGLFVGCITSNIMTGCAPWDIVFGSIATLLGAYGTYFMRKHKLAAVIPPILANTLIIPWILHLVYQFEGSILYFTATVFAGEFISIAVLGTLLRIALEKNSSAITWQHKTD